MAQENVLFPYDTVRSEQQKLVTTVQQTLEQRGRLFVHAPTGLGKTAATLSPALTHVQQHDLVILYLTSRHTQHSIVLETVQRINERHGTSFICTSLVGKQSLCLQENATSMRSNDFFMFCKHLREEEQCTYYTNARGKQRTPVDLALNELLQCGTITAQHILQIGRDRELCPYEVGLMVAERAHVIITDYFYLFQPSIRESFLKKINRKLEQCILIVDEGHNLPDRLRELMSRTLSTTILKGAMNEAKKFQPTLVGVLQKIDDAFVQLAGPNAGQKLVDRQSIITAVEQVKNYNELVSELIFAGEEAIAEQRQSRLAWVASFLEAWTTNDKGYTRIVTKEHQGIKLTLRCLDPALLSKPVLDQAHAAILMSATLSPIKMYKDILGVQNAKTEELESPFSRHNRLSLVIPKTTTRFTQRSETQFKHIAALCAQVANTIPGNIITFFPSYNLRDAVYEHFVEWYDHTVFLEQPTLTKEERGSLLEKFKKQSRSALLAVSTGSFGEGIDLPRVLKGILIVGLPLDRPDLETRELIKYYDGILGKGWDYGYILPAMNKIFQNAGRCIRTETDYGVIAFIDERFAWQQYFKAFPTDWNVRISTEYLSDIERFFQTKFV